MFVLPIRMDSFVYTLGSRSSRHSHTELGVFQLFFKYSSYSGHIRLASLRIPTLWEAVH